MTARLLAVAAVVLLIVLLVGCGSPRDGALPQGIALGDARPDALLFWGRCPRHSYLNLRVHEPDKNAPPRAWSAPTPKKSDFTARIPLTGLVPDRGYEYAAWCASTPHTAGQRAPYHALRNRFRMPPASNTVQPVVFAFGGDIAGQNVCRDAKEGFPALRAMRERKPDFFIALGDLIYADDVCKKTGLFGNVQIPMTAGKSVNLEDIRAHWRYNRSDKSYRALLNETFYYALWDDHEVYNDFSPPGARSPNPTYPDAAKVLRRGVRAFREYNPIASAGKQAKTSAPFHRSFHWGANLEFFILDNRTYREANAKPDTGPRPKTMLGKEQREWLLQGLAESKAVWKFVVSSVPMSIPTGTNAPLRGRDGWANYKENTGYERELKSILEFARARRVRNLVWITTDVHFAQVLRYRPFGDDFVLHEVVTGPLSAGLYPNRDLDPTLRPERLFFHGPEKINGAQNFQAAKAWFNFGLVNIDAKGNLKIAIINGNNKQLYELKLKPR